MTPEERVSLTRPDDDGERRAIDDIRKYGVHILHIFDGEGKDPSFSYTVGLWHTHHHPEIIIIGLKEDLRHTLLNNLNYHIGHGRMFTDGLSAKDVLDGYTCYFQEFTEEHFRDYLGWDRWFYEGNNFKAVQMLWPSVHGIYPWDDQASEELKWTQPILTKKPLIIS